MSTRSFPIPYTVNCNHLKSLFYLTVILSVCRWLGFLEEALCKCQITIARDSSFSSSSHCCGPGLRSAKCIVILPTRMIILDLDLVMNVQHTHVCLVQS